MAVWTASKALRPLTDFVVAGTDQGHISACTGAHVVADAAVLTWRVGTGVERRLAAMTSEALKTAAAERVHKVLTGSVVETWRGKAIINVSLTVATYTGRWI